MIPKTLRSFISEVQSATEKRKIAWYEVDAGGFVCDHKTNTLHISPHQDDDGETSVFVFRLIINGKITRFTVRDNERDDYLTMSNLYEAVEVNANGTDLKTADFF